MILGRGSHDNLTDIKLLLSVKYVFVMTERNCFMVNKLNDHLRNQNLVLILYGYGCDAGCLSLMTSDSNLQILAWIPITVFSRKLPVRIKCTEFHPKVNLC